MKLVLVCLSLLLFSTTAFAGGLGDPNPPPTRYIELAGKVVITDGAIVLKSNGHEYVLDVGATEPGVSRLKSGMAIIVKGQLTITDDAESGTTRTVRPSQLVIWGRAYDYPQPDASDSAP